MNLIQGYHFFPPVSCPIVHSEGNNRFNKLALYKLRQLCLNALSSNHLKKLFLDETQFVCFFSSLLSPRQNS